MFQEASVIGTVVEAKKVKVVVFKRGEDTMLILPAYKGSAESTGAALLEGTVVRLSGQVTAAAISKQGTPYIKMDVWHVLRLGTSDANSESPAELLPGEASIVLVGNLGRDPELRYTSKEQPVCNFSVATGKDPTVWFRVAVWGRQGEVAAEHLYKGARVLVAGRVDIPEPWKGRDGQPRVNLSVTAKPFGVVFLSPPKQQQAAPQRQVEEEGVPW